MYIAHFLKCRAVSIIMARFYFNEFIFLAIVMELAIGQRNSTRTLNILSFLSYPDNDTDLKPLSADGPETVYGAYLALESIRNRTDILWPDYNLELIETDDGCNLTFKAVTNLITHLYYSGKHVVGYVGPECSNSIQAVSQLTGRPDIALINVHLGNSPSLADRITYPYSYGVLRSTDIDVNALVALFRHNKWTRTAILYNPYFLADYTSYKLFTEKLKGVATIAVSSPVTADDIPLTEVRYSYARVIVTFLRHEILQNTLCVAYHMNMTYPRYQWILVQVYHYTDLSPVSFIYNETEYQCDSKQIAAVLNRRLTTWSQKTNPMFDEHVTRFPEFCRGKNFRCFAIFDAVWAIALALNNSVEPLKAKGLSLTGKEYGNVVVTDVIRKEMLKLKFQGVTGNIEFNQTTGFIATKECSIFQFFVDTQTDQEIALYSSINGTIAINDTVALFVSTNFDKDFISVSLPLAAAFVVLNTISSVVIIVVQILNLLYRNAKSVKASSIRLNNFAYVGCHLANTATVLYTVLVTFGMNMSADAKSALCITYPCSMVIGLTLVLGTVLVKTVRLYYIFRNPLKRASRLFSDIALSAAIIALTSLSIILCLVWIGYDRFMRVSEKTFTQSGDSITIVVSESCYSKHQVKWVAAAVIFLGLLLMASVLFAFMSIRIIKVKVFQTHSIIPLAYILCITNVIGGIIYFVSIITGSHLNLRYAVLCLLYTLAVYLCIFFLFIPPIKPVIRTLLHLKM